LIDCRLILFFSSTIGNEKQSVLACLARLMYYFHFSCRSQTLRLVLHHRHPLSNILFIQHLCNISLLISQSMLMFVSRVREPRCTYPVVTLPSNKMRFDQLYLVILFSFVFILLVYIWYRHCATKRKRENRSRSYFSSSHQTSL
jgi:hypothetical protein